jgi:hypothetical protein
MRGTTGFLERNTAETILKESAITPTLYHKLTFVFLTSGILKKVRTGAGKEGACSAYGDVAELSMQPGGDS